ncbi:hypothetical protein [Actinomyces howellii]|uniref:Uncharacterized protein n=1 Tax=Actinomyces howellii TaxID=52771 RepID=A0A3S5EH16_9ACTO|nr:hypothetical protein [Actinomyces howellii]VEG28065.1 Uncharacterised protein [Actinomyces howellii]
MARIVGSVVSPAGAPLPGWVRLEPSPPVAVSAGDLVVASSVTGALDAAGRLDLEVLEPAGVAWDVTACLGTVVARRRGVVLPVEGTVSLAWLLGLADQPVEPVEPVPPVVEGVVVVSDDGLTYVQPAVVDGELFTTDLAVASADGLTYTIETTGGGTP